MQPGERFGLIQRIYATLMDEYSDWSWPIIDALLSEFGADSAPATDDPAEGLLTRLRSLGDGRLVELHAHLHPQDSDASALLVAQTPPSAVDEAGPWQDGALRVFISHTTANKELAGGISTWMARVGIECFVAHTDIEPTREWQDVIESGLRTCHVLVALLTDDFSGSRWCDQEVGFAVGRGILIVPVRMGVDPYGFIGKVQGLTLPGGVTPASRPMNLSSQIFDLLAKNPLTSARMTDPIVRRFAQSWSWDNSRSAWPYLTALPREAWTEERLELVREAARSNVDVTEGVLSDGTGTKLPVHLENYLRSVGIELNPSSAIDFVPRPSGRPMADDDIPV